MVDPAADEGSEVEIIASLNDYHYEGRMFQDHHTGEMMVLGGTHSINSANSLERLDSETNTWKFETLTSGDFPINYRRFSMAERGLEGPSYFFGGFAVNDNGTYFIDNPLTYDLREGTVEESPNMMPKNGAGLGSLFDAKKFDSIANPNFLVHHRVHECTNNTMR